MNGPTFETILYEQVGPVVTLTMNRPERRNAMSNRMVREVGDALAHAAEDRSVRILVLTGAGTSFCPGADLQAVASGASDAPLEPRELYFLPGKLDADEALRIGLVSVVVDDEAFAEAVRALVERLAAAAPAGLRTMKQNFSDAERMDLAAFVDLESERHLRLFRLHDTREAFLARVEKRPPRFEGR